MPGWDESREDDFALAAISGFFRWAVSWDRVDRNPVDRLPSMKAEPTKVYDIFDAAENARIAAAQAMARERGLL